MGGGASYKMSAVSPTGPAVSSLNWLATAKDRCNLRAEAFETLQPIGESLLHPLLCDRC